MKHLLFITALFFSFALHAQKSYNPYASIGKKGKMLTLSNGKYNELELYDSLQRIGSVIVNMNTGKIHKLLPIDTVKSIYKYDPTAISRWYSVDPHAVKYPSLSPYNFVGNMPLIAVDPDGRDIVFLIAKEGAGGMGHMAVLVQDKSGQWYYVTQGGNIPDGTTTSQVVTGAFQGGYNLTALNTTDVKEAIARAKTDASNKPYTEEVLLKTTKKQDEQIFNNAGQLAKDYESGKEEYQLLTNNCVDADQCTVQKGTGIRLPLDIDPRPNKYFDKLKEFAIKSNQKFDSSKEGKIRTLKETVKFVPPAYDESSSDVPIE